MVRLDLVREKVRRLKDTAAALRACTPLQASALAASRDTLDLVSFRVYLGSVRRPLGYASAASTTLPASISMSSAARGMPQAAPSVLPIAPSVSANAMSPPLLPVLLSIAVQ
jgi:hypothetical protein